MTEALSLRGIKATTAVQSIASAGGGMAKRAIAGEEILSTSEIATDLFAGAAGGWVGHKCESLTKNLELPSKQLIVQLAKKYSGKVARPIAKGIVKSVSRLFEDDSQFGLVRRSDLNADGSLKDNAIVDFGCLKTIEVIVPKIKEE